MEKGEIRTKKLQTSSSCTERGYANDFKINRSYVDRCYFNSLTKNAKKSFNLASYYNY